MPEFLKSAGRVLRRALDTTARSPEAVEEAYVAGATDRIDLELRIREARRATAGRMRRLGGASYV